MKRFRDGYEVVLKCPICGTSGKAQVSEEGYPFMRGLHFRVDALDPAFRVQTEGLDLRDTVFHCTACDVKAERQA